MNPFEFHRPEDAAAAVAAAARAKTAQQGAEVRFLAGGTTLLDLMKLNVETPARLLDINRLPLDKIEAAPDGGLKVGATVRNSDLAHHPAVRRDYAVLSQAILAGASAQLVKELYAEENKSLAEPSGSQDMVGLLYPGVSRLDYDHSFEGGIFPRHIESSNDPNAFESVITFDPDGDATLIEMRTLFPTKEARDEAVERYHAIEGGRQTLANLAAYVIELV